MNVAIIGSTGFIGSSLRKYLTDKGMNIVEISRDDLNHNERLREKIIKSEVVINLSGSSIMGIWTKRKRKRIYESRILITRRIVEIINECKKKTVYINASAVGIYDNTKTHSERSNGYANDFMANVVIDWEKEVLRINNVNVRFIILRMGIVIDKKGGYLGKQYFLIRKGIYIVLGKGIEYLPVISLYELVHVFLFIIHNEAMKGIVNAVAPFLTKLNEFYQCLAETRKVRFYFKIPNICIRVILGKSSLIFLKGQGVIPEKLLMNKYEFREKTLHDMIRNVLNM